jgi:hypothetical protein
VRGKLPLRSGRDQSVRVRRFPGDLTIARVLVRLVIAAGAFHVLRFETEIVGASTVCQTEFLGSGVIRAYRSEQFVRQVTE